MFEVLRWSALTALYMFCKEDVSSSMMMMIEYLRTFISNPQSNRRRNLIQTQTNKRGFSSVYLSLKAENSHSYVCLFIFNRNGETDFDIRIFRYVYMK
jgi:hypothetical protein